MVHPKYCHSRRCPPGTQGHEVRIRIHATTVTSGDVRLRKADPFAVRFFFGLFNPKSPILGHEVAGVVEAVGSKVTRFRIGDRVFGSTGMRSGTYAEYICLPEDGAIAMTPDQVPHGEAATLTVGALTALHFINAAKLQRGRAHPHPRRIRLHRHGRRAVGQEHGRHGQRGVQHGQCGADAFARRRPGDRLQARGLHQER